MQRPYPILPPPPQKKPICVIPFPGSGKKAVQTFNPREYWAWGANLVGSNCAAFSTSLPEHLFEELPPSCNPNAWLDTPTNKFGA